MAQENRLWGYDRIQGALNYLDYMISTQTMGYMLKRHGISPAPEPSGWEGWRQKL